MPGDRLHRGHRAQLPRTVTARKRAQNSRSQAVTLLSPELGRAGS